MKRKLIVCLLTAAFLTTSVALFAADTSTDTNAPAAQKGDSSTVSKKDSKKDDKKSKKDSKKADVDKRIADLKKKKTDGTLTKKEEQQLARLEQVKKNADAKPSKKSKKDSSDNSDGK